MTALTDATVRSRHWPPETMLAARYPTFGPEAGIIRVEHVPTPNPQAGEVLVAVTVSGVSPTDWKQRAADDAHRPQWIIPNQDGAGVIVGVGAGVPLDRLGDRVWLWQAQWQRAGGTAAQYVAVPAAHAVTLAPEVPFDLGAQLGIPAMTAHRLLCARGPLSDANRILVQGGAGAVGHAAIELSRRAGVRVAATVSGPKKAAIAESAGAELVIDRHRENVAERVLEWAPRGVDRVLELDLPANIDDDVAVIARNGVISVYVTVTEPVLPPRRLASQNASIDFTLVYTMPEEAKRAAVAEITAALSEGSLSQLPVTRFDLAETAAAHDAVQSAVTGRILIDIAPVHPLQDTAGPTRRHQGDQ